MNMQTLRYLCRVDDAGHEDGVGWRAALRMIDSHHAEPEKFSVIVPYSHPIFGDATAYFAPDKKVYLTVVADSFWRNHAEDGSVLFSDGHLDLLLEIEPYRERMHDENWPWISEPKH